MNPELKQRLIGAVVVTALAAIFIPMLFDDPVENSGQQVAELTLPKPPEPPKTDAAKKLPDDFGNALAPVEQEDTNTQSSTEAPTQVIEEIEPTPTEKNTEDDLVATEADNEDAAPVKNITPNTLDTGVVAEDSHADDENSKPSRNETNKANLSTIEKSAKKLKSHEATTATKLDLPDDIAVDQTTPKTSTKPTTSKNNTELGRWSIQAGSFSKKDNAMALLEKLQKQGFPVSLQTKGNIYRLKIGPELDKKRIINMKKKLDDQHIQAFIIAE